MEKTLIFWQNLIRHCYLQYFFKGKIYIADKHDFSTLFFFFLLLYVYAFLFQSNKIKKAVVTDDKSAILPPKLKKIKEKRICYTGNSLYLSNFDTDEHLSTFWFATSLCHTNFYLHHSFLQGWNPSFSGGTPSFWSKFKKLPPLSESHPNWYM